MPASNSFYLHISYRGLANNLSKKSLRMLGTLIPQKVGVKSLHIYRSNLSYILLGMTAFADFCVCNNFLRCHLNMPQ